MVHDFTQFFFPFDLIFVFANKIGNGSLNSIRGPHYTVIKTSVFTKETPLVSVLKI